MSRPRWHVLRDAGSVTVTRILPLRWDVQAETQVPRAGRLRLAQQVRQDVWRALRHQRGFAPAVTVTLTPQGCLLRAGGRIDSVFDRDRLENQIVSVLNAPENRARWLRFAARYDQTVTSPRRATESDLTGTGAP